MNALETIVPEFPPCSFAAGGQRIAVAVLHATLGGSTPFACLLFLKAMEGGLRRLGIATSYSGALFGPGFVLWLAEVADPNPALQAVRQVLGEMELMAMCEIAFWNAEDSAWQTIHPLGSPLPFGRFLVPAAVEAAVERTAADQEFLKNLMAFFRAKLASQEKG